MNNQNITKAIAHFHEIYGKGLNEFQEFLKIPSVSTSEEHKNDVLKAADFLVDQLNQLNFTNVKAFPTQRHPLVFGEYIVSSDKPTILIYGHYDVQPPDPLALWNSPPFESQIQDDYIYARGASDMKGQIWAVLSALRAILETGELSVNVKILYEGEEEIGSPSLDEFLKTHQSMLKCDIVLNPDAGMLAPNKPTITYALRGMAYFELKITGPKADLHSGLFGGVVGNPANILCDLISKMHNEEGQITLPGFFDAVIKISDEEREDLSQLGINENFYKNNTGVRELAGETGFSPVERVSARPTLDVNGLYAGYIQEGAKTIIPSYAMAKISTRLVPDQNPALVHESFKTFLEENVPPSVTWDLKYLSGAPAYLSKLKGNWFESYLDALEKTWGEEPLKKRDGGSIPVATSMKEILGVNSILTGFGLPDDQIHSPNERMHIPTHKKGVEALIRFFLSI
jgi:acetylornithine deacetylase/succinyl-diaminopimelate desuccinylase-like protein